MEKIFKHIVLLVLVLLTGTLMGNAANLPARVDGVFKLGNDNRKIVVEISEIQPLSSKIDAMKERVDIGNTRNFVFNINLEKPCFFNFNIIIGEGANAFFYSNVIVLFPGSVINLEFLPKDTSRVTCNYSLIKDINNRSMVMLGEKYNDYMENNFNNPPANDGESISYLDRFYLLADSLLSQKDIDPMVRKYIKFKSAESYNLNLYKSSIRDLSKTHIEYYDDEFVLMYRYSIQNLISYLNVSSGLKPFDKMKSLDQIKNQVDMLNKIVSITKVRDLAIESWLRSYVYRYKVINSFENDKKIFNEIAGLICDSEISSEMIRNFENLQYTINGASFPSSDLVDINGERFIPEKYKGKYVLIDVWGTWCVPCMKMIPFFQKLEKEYCGKNIVFIGICTSSEKEAWLRKLQQLHFDGEQFFDSSSEFTKIMNITAIPHYLIYDPEGHLVVYKTDMPDSPKIREILDSLIMSH
jgi:thiol-disulfide isomerase/thioredoxin